MALTTVPMHKFVACTEIDPRVGELSMQFHSNAMESFSEDTPRPANSNNNNNIEETLEEDANYDNYSDEQFDDIWVYRPSRNEYINNNNNDQSLLENNQSHNNGNEMPVGVSSTKKILSPKMASISTTMSTIPRAVSVSVSQQVISTTSSDIADQQHSESTLVLPTLSEKQIQLKPFINGHQWEEDKQQVTTQKIGTVGSNLIENRNEQTMGKVSKKQKSTQQQQHHQSAVTKEQSYCIMRKSSMFDISNIWNCFGWYIVTVPRDLNPLPNSL